ncbi:ATP-binding protein [Tomitella gaofuii]|uniref:ATP-binding protein n=1 Tax=Tomitella gaofuii TaxID=2760083 RepID=UPI002E29205C|nr:ATP-binding protein [Tomitella gaofuii]
MTVQGELELDGVASPDPAEGSPGTLHPGQYRLSRIQVVNWGTLDGHHDIAVPRRGLLITGPSGSGKSTLIDAVSAVLMPASAVRFNAAAQESSRQSGRSLITYMRGAWRREADADSDALTSSYLRPGATWSAIALTYSTGVDTEPRGAATTSAKAAGGTATLVKLMHVGRGTSSYGDVKQLHLLVDGDADLPEFERHALRGLDTRAIKKAFPHATVHSSYAPFARAFRNRLGIASESAQRLLHRTLSAKSLSSLDQLFREYMLDEPRTFATRDNAVEQFRNLREAHRTVVDARRQIETLAPLVALARDRSAAVDEHATLTEEGEHLDAVHASLTLALLRDSHEQLQARSAQLDTAAAAARSDAVRAQDVVLDVRSRLDGAGGGRVSTLRAQRDASADGVARAEARRAKVAAALAVWDAEVPATGDDFADVAGQLRAELQRIDAEREERRDALFDVQSRRAAARDERDALVADRETLARRRSNLDPAILRARERLCSTIGIAEDAVPFVGELLEVREDEARWTGPAERVLHGLARTMLVPDEVHPRLAEAVDATHLGTRLVYRRIRTGARLATEPTSDGSLVRKLAVKPGPFADWLHAHLSRGFDYVCVEDAAALRDVARGVTLSGQIRHGGERHEKDDRHRIDDRSRWVLGFDNEAKLNDLRRRIDEAGRELARLEQSLSVIDADDARLRERESAARAVLDVGWEEIDVDGARAHRDQLTDRIHALTTADSEYSALTAELAHAESVSESATTARSTAEAARTAHEDRITEVRDKIAEAEAADAAAAPVPGPVDTRIRRRFDEAVRRVTVDNIDRTLARVGQQIDAGLRRAQHQAMEAGQRIVAVLHEYLGAWEERRADLRADADYVDDALAVLAQLRGEGLPEYEDAFFDMLREQSHRNIGELANLIRKAPSEIRARIEPVNRSLSRSPFDTDRTLRIDVKDRRPAVAAEFLADLHRIASGAFEAEDRAAAEDRFASMAALLERLDSGDPADQRWQRHVLDTRMHVGFIGVELDPEGREANYHDSSAGLSGGQAQKLVFFCLAAALRYQLAEDGADLPRYATVVLDEAFDRADPAYTRRALDVFDQFGFHMVLATPLKLLQTLDDYIGGVVTVAIRDRNRTELSYLPIETADAP